MRRKKSRRPECTLIYMILLHTGHLRRHLLVRNLWGSLRKYRAQNFKRLCGKFMSACPDTFP